MANSKVKIPLEERIKQAYISYMLDNGSRPASVFKFMKELKMKESTFYNYYNSLDVLENAIWEGYITETVKTLHSDDNYLVYSSREKLLAFYYTFIEIIKDNRSYVLMRTTELKAGMAPVFLKSFRNAFKLYVEDVLIEGQESGEVASRKFLDKTYSEGFWLQLLFVLRFWSNDESKGFEKTDEAIEKAVNLSFELIGNGPLEKMVDFAKFLYQNR